MKKILMLFFIVILSFSAFGCSSSKNTVSAPSDDKAGNDGTANDSSENENDQKEEMSRKNDIMVTEYDESSSSLAGSSDNSSNYSLVKSKNDAADNELSIAVGNAVLSANEGAFLEGEIKAEGHIILQESTASDDSKIVYVLTMYGEYGFQNDSLIKVSGTGAVPAVVTFGYSKDTGYMLKNYSVPDDGSGYTDSVKKMFPKDLYNYVLSVTESDLSSLQSQERKYGKAYLNKLGRSSVIGDYSDIDHQYPEIDDELSEQIFKRYWEYPDWIGTKEKIEDGTRYVYETQWKNYGNNDSMIYFSKYVYSTGEIIKTINVFIDDGEVKSSEEKVSKIVENSLNSSSQSMK